MEPPKITTEETYKNNVTARGLPVDIEALDGFSLCWIGSRNAKKVIVYACGGGLVMHCYDVHILFLINGYKVMKDNGQDVAIAVVAYGVCPGAPYPTQIRQMVSTVQHLTKSRAPETINFSGDSAGGMLVLALLLHHLHPHPSVPPYTLPPGSRFGEALLISPGAPVITETASWHQSENKDVITREQGEQMWSLITSTSDPGVEMPNPWIGSSSAPANWWKDLLVGKVTVVLGDYEVLKDDIMLWSGYLKKNHDREVEIHTFPEEVHEQTLIDMMMGITEDKGSTKFWKQWFQDFKS